MKAGEGPKHAHGGHVEHGHKGHAKHEGHPESPQRRINNELRRIQEGVKKGFLTSDEAGKLTTEVDAIQAELEKDRAGGAKLTSADRTALKGELNKASSDIFDQNQTGRVSKLEGEGKLTSAQSTVLDSQIGLWAGGIADKGNLLGSDWHALNGLIRTDEKTSSAVSGSASSSASSSASA